MTFARAKMNQVSLDQEMREREKVCDVSMFRMSWRRRSCCTL